MELGDPGDEGGDGPDGRDEDGHDAAEPEMTGVPTVPGVGLGREGRTAEIDVDVRDVLPGRFPEDVSSRDRNDRMVLIIGDRFWKRENCTHVLTEEDQDERDGRGDEEPLDRRRVEVLGGARAGDDDEVQGLTPSCRGK